MDSSIPWHDRAPVSAYDPGLRIPPIPAAPPPIPIRAGHRFKVGDQFATVLADIDFETYSEAGMLLDLSDPKKPMGKWVGPEGATKKGLFAVGMRVYAEHPTTEVLSMSYDLKDGRGKRRWRPGLPNPQDLFDYIAQGGLVEAHNSGFERVIWTFVCQRLYGWPAFPPAQWRCSAAKSRAWGLPGALANVGDVLNIASKKDADGKRLLDKFSIPRTPTQKDKRYRIRPEEDPEDGEKLYAYNDRDIEAEAEVSARVPDLIPMELDYWLADQAINFRGIGVDLEGARNCAAIVRQCLSKYTRQMVAITGGIEPGQLQALKGWMAAFGVYADSLDEDGIAALLSRTDLPPHVRQVLEIRQLTGSASVKKVFAMLNHATVSGRLCDLFIYHGARTGRDTHADVQPGNLPKAGPDIKWCQDAACMRPYAKARDCCPWCGTSAAFSSETAPDGKTKGWTFQAVEHVLQVIATQSVDCVEWFFGDALLSVSGVIRSLLVAGPGKRLICSDYSSIEAVVTACLSGEQWRIDAFHRGECIYLHGAAGITGRTYEWYMANGGKKHPDRQKLGKPGELGLGFGGWVNAWRQFGGEGTDDEVKANIVAWREKSPMVVEMWGGQFRGTPWAPTRVEYFGLEGMAVLAVLNPGQSFAYRAISYQVIDDVLYCTLPSGRRIAYHQPRLNRTARREGWAEVYELSYMTWNTNPKMGPLGWVRMQTYGGRLFENVVQGTARDVMSHAVVNLERRNYPVVLRVHDEIGSEVDEGFGSLVEFEAIMCDVPPWARGWPIRAGGWEGQRYRKDD